MKIGLGPKRFNRGHGVNVPLNKVPTEPPISPERPLRADGRFGGHFVQGHVDAVATIEAFRPEADFHWLTVAFPPRLGPLIVHRGSIAVDGVSLTAAGLTA